MIVFLNGAFGVGETTVARLLYRFMPESLLFDPEQVGAMLWTTLKERTDWPGDYQSLPAWRRLVLNVIRELRRDHPNPLIVPMTVWRAEVWRDLESGLRSADPELLAFRLTATEETLRARILARPDEDGPHAWCLRHLDVALAALRQEEFGIEVVTDERTPDEIAKEILRAL